MISRLSKPVKIRKNHQFESFLNFLLKHVGVFFKTFGENIHTFLNIVFTSINVRDKLDVRTFTVSNTNHFLKFHIAVENEPDSDSR